MKTYHPIHPPSTRNVVNQHASMSQISSRQVGGEGVAMMLRKLLKHVLYPMSNWMHVCGSTFNDRKLIASKGRKRKIIPAENGMPAIYKWRRKRLG
jgi:hypothetical protein